MLEAPAQDWVRVGARDLFGKIVRTHDRGPSSCSARATGYAAYLQAEFADWRVDSNAQKIGWNVRPDPFAFFRCSTWALDNAQIVNVWTNVAALDRMFIPMTNVHFAAIGLVEWAARRGGRPTHVRRRLPLYFAALALSAVPVISHASRGMSSRTRFALCWDAALFLILAGLRADRPDWAKEKWVRVILFGCWRTNSRTANSSAEPLHTTGERNGFNSARTPGGMR